MNDKDLGSKTINNEQKVNEGFSGDNIPGDYNPKEKMATELETDENGNTTQVDRARKTSENNRNWDENESLSRGVKTEDAQQKTVENKDRNSDIATNRYPNSHPDNHYNRGNIKLDEE